MSDIRKQSLKFALIFAATTLLVAEVWDYLIFIWFPERGTAVTHFAAAYLYSGDVGRYLGAALWVGLSIYLLAMLLSWLVRRIGANGDYFAQQREWVWALAGVTISLIEFTDVVDPTGDFLLNCLGLVWLAILYESVRRFKRQTRQLGRTRPTI